MILLANDHNVLIAALLRLVILFYPQISTYMLLLFVCNLYLN